MACILIMVINHLLLLASGRNGWGATNAGGISLATPVAYRYREWFQGWKAYLLILTTPLLWLAFWVPVGMPAFIIINGSYSWLATQAGGLITVLLVIPGMALIMDTVLNRNPWALESNGPVSAERAGIGLSKS
jgi:hypothetical protein